MNVIDISLPVHKNTVVWPGNTEPNLVRVKDMEQGEICNETFISMNAHTGTHLDAPLHFLEKGGSIDAMDLGIFFGPVFVADMGEAKNITEKELEVLHLPEHTERILFKTSNSLLWKNRVDTFKKDYVGLTPSAARWLVSKRMRLVGNDYLSVATFNDAAEVHDILLGAGIAALEGIDLTHAAEGEYELICFPLRLDGAEAAPTRAVLIER